MVSSLPSGRRNGQGIGPNHQAHSNVQRPPGLHGFFGDTCRTTGGHHGKGGKQECRWETIRAFDPRRQRSSIGGGRQSISTPTSAIRRSITLALRACSLAHAVGRIRYPCSLRYRKISPYDLGNVSRTLTVQTVTRKNPILCLRISATVSSNCVGFTTLMHVLRSNAPLDPYLVPERETLRYALCIYALLRAVLFNCLKLRVQYRSA